MSLGNLLQIPQIQRFLPSIWTIMLQLPPLWYKPLESWKILLMHIMRKEKGVFASAAELTESVFVKTFIVVQRINLKTLLHLSMANPDCIRTIILDLGHVILFLSELKMRQLLEASVPHLYGSEISAENIFVQVWCSEKKTIYTPVRLTKPAWVS